MTQKLQTFGIKKTVDNMGFARCGGEGNLRNILENIRKKLFHFLVFRNFKKWKMFLLAFGSPLHLWL